MSETTSLDIDALARKLLNGEPVVIGRIEAGTVLTTERADWYEDIRKEIVNHAVALRLTEARQRLEEARSVVREQHRPMLSDIALSMGAPQDHKSGDGETK